MWQHWHMQKGEHISRWPSVPFSSAEILIDSSDEQSISEQGKKMMPNV